MRKKTKLTPLHWANKIDHHSPLQDREFQQELDDFDGILPHFKSDCSTMARNREATSNQRNPEA